MTSALLLLDTNILVHVIRQDATGKAVEDRFHLSGCTERPLLSIVTVGESLALGRSFGWGDAKLAALRNLFRSLVIVDISRGGIVERYAEIADGVRRLGRTLSDNDLWIAASASFTGATLVTTDKGFDGVDRSLLTHV